MVGQTLAHVVQEKVGIGPDQLEGLRDLALDPAGHVFRHMAGNAARGIEDLLAAQDLRVARATPFGHAKVAGIEGDKVQVRLRHLKPVGRVRAGFRDDAGGLTGGTIAVTRRMERRRQPHVARKCARGLFLDGGLTGLVAEAAQHRRPVAGRDNDVRAAGNAVAIRVVGVGMGKDLGRRDRLKKAKADHLLRHPGRQHQIGRGHPVARIGQRIGRGVKDDRLAVREGQGDLGRLDPHPALGGDPGQAEVLQLPAIDRVGVCRDPVRDQRGFGCGPARHRQAQEKADGVFVRRRRGQPAPVLQVAKLAGPRIEKRAEPVGGLGGGRRGHPGLGEKPVAEVEGHPALKPDIGRGVGKGVCRGPCAHRRRARGLRLEPLGGGKIPRGRGDRCDAGCLCGGAGQERQVQIPQVAGIGPGQGRCGAQQRQGGRRKPEGSRHWKTSPVPSSVSSPSTTTPARPSAVDARSIDRDCVTSASTTALIAVSPSALPTCSSMS